MTIRNVLQIGSLLVSSSDWYSQEELQIIFFFLSSVRSENKWGS